MHPSLAPRIRRNNGAGHLDQETTFTTENLLIRWRRIVLSANGPGSPVTRLVLAALSCYMDNEGRNAFPSIQTLAIDTAISTRSVKEHLATAVSEGWIRRQSRRLFGQKWRRYDYEIRFPLGAEGGERRAPRLAIEGGEARAEGGEPGAKGGAPGSH